MIDPRWRKVLRDLFSGKLRTLLVVLSIGVGVFAVGFVATTYVVLSHDLPEDYQKINAHAASLFVSPFRADDLINSVEKVEGVGDAEGRNAISGRVQTPTGEWKQMMITVIDHPEEMQVDLIRPAQGDGHVEVDYREALLERTVLTVMQVQPGDMLTIELPDKRTKQLKVRSLVHDLNMVAPSMGGVISLYVTPRTMDYLGYSDYMNQLLITVKENKSDEAHVRAVAGEVTHLLEKKGYQVYATVIYQPGQNPMQTTIQSILLLMGALGGLAVFLSGFLVVNTINAQISQHVRQIGVMKAIGATSRQVSGMYMALVLSYGVLALLIALPLSTVIAWGLISGMGSMLNYRVGAFRVPGISLIMQLAVALLLPLIASLAPIRGGSRKTVREAISNYGIGAGAFGKSMFDKLIETVRFLPRPLLISLRNTFRRKGRLLLTLSTLTLAGAIFIAVFNIQAAFSNVIADTLGYFLSDINMNMGSMYHVDQVQELASHVEGVELVEGWGMQVGRVLSPNNDTSTEVAVVSPPSGSRLIQPVLTEGRWLTPEDENAIVVGNHFLKQRPEMKIGDTLTVKVDEKEIPFKVVGYFQAAGTFIPPFVYTNFEFTTRALNIPDQAVTFRIKLADNSPANEDRVATQLKQLFQAHGYAVGAIEKGYEIQAQQSTGTNILVSFLMSMALLIAVVGGLGLMGTMGMNVLERTREIGVMRSIGASNLTIVTMVVFEGLLIGTISWLLGSLLSIPISMVLNTTVGLAFLFVPMDLVISVQGFVYWLIIVWVIAALASLLPALNAARLTVRDVLAYE